MKHHLLFFFFLCVWLFAPGNAGAQQPSEFINAYVFGVRAEQAESSGQLDEALGFFGESLRLYQETAKVHPEWKPSVVQYRITATANHMERIKRLVEVEEKKKKAEAEAAIRTQLDQAIAEARTEWLKEKDTRDRRIAELMAERTSMQESVRSGQAELKKSQELLAELDKVISDGGKRITNLEKRLDDAKVKVKEQQAGLTARDQQIADLQKHIADLPPPLISPEELEALRKELAASNARADGLQAEVTSATEKVNTLMEKVNALEDQRTLLQADTKETVAAREAEVRELKRAGMDILQQMAMKDRLITDLQYQLTNQPPPLITPEDLLVLQARVYDLQQETERQRERQRVLESELAAATTALDATRKDQASVSETEIPLADYEKSQVENIVFRDTIQTLSNQLAELSVNVSSAADELAREQKNWDAERSEFNDRITALMETIDLNQEEVSKVRELRAEVKRLEKETRKLTKEVDAARALEPVEK